MKFDGWQIPLATIAGVMGASAYFYHPATSSEAVAAWVQAVGSIGAILAAVWISNKQYRDTRELEARRAADDAAKDLAETVAFVEAIREELITIWAGYSSDAQKRLRATEKEAIFDYNYPVSSDAFTIYNGASSRVGKVPDAEVRKLIVMVYAQAKGLVSSFQLNNSALHDYHEAKLMLDSDNLRGHMVLTQMQTDLSSYAHKLKKRDTIIDQDLHKLLKSIDRWLDQIKSLSGKSVSDVDRR
ncbi:hypothetical protein [Pseudomonas aeruginosa]